ncbi:tubby-related protein 2 isoform X1 [Peromyscus leucopus]|uniref:tubby-related protein 2 isoform X1 n=2 Tax=Peromyscus leucopus TaxID=10041 RepID=UPI001884CA5C|nr:tubby-related protein 2 isoform X1 [Peromyscus leucopus]
MLTCSSNSEPPEQGISLLQWPRGIALLDMDLEGPRGPSQENEPWKKETVEDEFSGVRLQKLEQQQQLLEKKQRRRRQEPLMVQANPDASLRHRRPRRGDDRFQWDSGWGFGAGNPFLQENVPQAHLPSRPPGALLSMGYVRDGGGQQAPLLPPTGAVYTQGDGAAVHHLCCVPDSSESDVEEVTMEDIPVIPPPPKTHLATRCRGWLASPGPGISEEEEVETKDAAFEPKAPSPAPAPTVSSGRVQEHLASCEEEENTAQKDIETRRPASGLGDEDLAKKEGSESAGTDSAPVPPKVLQDNKDPSNQNPCTWMCPAARPPGPRLGEDVEAYVLLPAARDHVVQCRIIRNKHGMDKGFFPSYYLYQEAEDGVAHFLLAGRKRKICKTSNYLISLDPKDMSRNGNNFVGKVRSNILGTKFTIFDNGVNPHRNYWIPDSTRIREKLGVVCYESNVLGFRGPRKMTVILPGMDRRKQRMRVQPQNDQDSIVSRLQKGARQGPLLLQNKAPSWSDESGGYVLNFHGRVTRASVKNFQIVHPDLPDYLVLQFGRVAPNIFTMDFQYPLCPLQAFAICLSSFDGKLACN